MKVRTARAIRDMADEVGIEIKIVDYSGRSMFGARTIGIVYNDERELEHVLLKIVSAGTGGDDFIDQTTEFRRDNMGKQFVVY